MSADQDLGRAAGRALREVRLEVAAGAVELSLEGLTVILRAVRGANLLGPWDGQPGVVEWLREVYAEDGEHCLELRVQYGPVPRVYRVVCGGVELRPAGTP